MQTVSTPDNDTMWRIDQTTTPAAILHLAHACTGRTPAPLKHCKTTGSWATQVQGLKEMSLATGMSLTGVLGFFHISWGGVYSRLGLCNHTQQCCQCHHVITVTATQSVSIQNCSNTDQSLVTPTQSESIQNCSNTDQSLQSLQHKASPYRTAATQISH